MSKVGRMTPATLAVLCVLLADPAGEQYGLAICTAAGLKPGTVHPILARFEALGWLVSRWEDIDPKAAARPKRRLYRLSEDGAMLARKAVVASQESARQRTFAPGLAQGGAV